MLALLFFSVELLIVFFKKNTALFCKPCFLADSYDVSSDLVQTGL